MPAFHRAPERPVRPAVFERSKNDESSDQRTNPVQTALAGLQRAVGNAAVAQMLGERSSTQLQRQPPAGAATSPGTSLAPADADQVTSGLRERVLSWRVSAYQGLNDFADSALEDAINKTPDVNDASLGIALATGLMNSLSAAFPIEGAVLRPFFQKATAEVVKAVGQRAVQVRPGAGSDRPISAVKHDLELIVDFSERAFYEGLPRVLYSVRRDWNMLHNEGPGPSTGPIPDGELLNRAAIEMFGYDNVVGDGFNTEIKSENVRMFYETEAKDKLKTYLREVHPIGEGRWGHKKVVVVKIVGKVNEYEDRTYAQVKRRVGSHEQYEYEFVRMIDDDMVAAALSRMEATTGEVATTLVPASEIEGLPVSAR